MVQRSRLLRFLVALFAASQIVGFVLAWHSQLLRGPGFSFQLAPNGMAFDEVGRLALVQTVAGVSLGLAALTALLFGLWHLERMLRSARDSSIFSLANIAHLRVFAGAAAVSIALSIAEVPLRGLLFKHVLGVPEAQIKMAVSSSDLFLLLLCMVFYLVADMMHAARKLAKENEAFV